LRGVGGRIGLIVGCSGGMSPAALANRSVPLERVLTVPTRK